MKYEILTLALDGTKNLHRINDDNTISVIPQTEQNRDFNEYQELVKLALPDLPDNALVALNAQQVAAALQARRNNGRV
jgi:hypothetical protein